MPPFTKETGKKAGKKSRRPKSIKNKILDQTQNGSLIVTMLIKMIKSAKTTNKDRMAAAKMLLEYSIGRPVVAVDATVDGRITFSWEGDDLSVNI